MAISCRVPVCIAAAVVILGCPGAQLSDVQLSWCPIVLVPMLLSGTQLSSAQLSWCPVVLVPICPVLSCPMPSCRGAQLFGTQLSGAQLSDARLSWCPIVLVPNCPGAQLSWCSIVLAPSCPVLSCRGAQLSYNRA